jgi:adenylate kinase
MSPSVRICYGELFIGELVNTEKLYKKWDNNFDCPIYDEDMVCDFLERIHEPGGYAVEFHSSDFFPERWFDLVVLLRCDNTQLFDRLKERGYSDKKIEENVTCEILEVTADQVKDSYKEEVILELRSDGEDNVEPNLNAIVDWLKAWAEKRKGE